MNILYHISNASRPRNLFTYFMPSSELSIYFLIHSSFIQPSFIIRELSKNSLHILCPKVFQRLIVFTLKPSFSLEINDSASLRARSERNGSFPIFEFSSYLNFVGIFSP